MAGAHHRAGRNGAPACAGEGIEMKAKAKVGILISGRGTNMMALAEAAVHPATPYTIAMVASDKPDAPGLAWARQHGIAPFALSPKGVPKADYETAIERALRGAGVETIALAGYMRLLSDEFVARRGGREVKKHTKELPKNK